MYKSIFETYIDIYIQEVKILLHLSNLIADSLIGDFSSKEKKNL